MRIVFDRILDDLGRISIPKEIRRALGWIADDTIQLCVNGDSVKIGKRIETNDDNDFHARWIPVSERLPDDEKQVLAYIGYEESMIGFETVLTYFAHDHEPHWQYQDLLRGKQRVLYWMPLPQPPKGEKE